jgi:hypothetical protein
MPGRWRDDEPSALSGGLVLRLLRRVAAGPGRSPFRWIGPLAPAVALVALANLTCVDVPSDGSPAGAAPHGQEDGAAHRSAAHEALSGGPPGSLATVAAPRGHQHGAPARHPVVGASHEPGGEVPATAAELAAAAQLVRDVWRGTARFADLAVAQAEGYRPLTPMVDGQVPYHNQAYYVDGRILDPERPEQLVYLQRLDGRLQFVAVMFLMRPGERGPRPGGPLTVWHTHELCLSPADGILLPVAKAPDDCPPGLRPFGVSPEMLHVWVVDNPAGVFARDLDPAALLRLIGTTDAS